MCRSFLTPDPINHKYYGRFNQIVCSLNLVDVALSSGGDFDRFWKILKERAELVHKAIQIRNKRLQGIKSDVAPIMWQHGALGRLKKGEVIDKFLINNYSTASFGYAGLYECVKYMTGESHSHGKGFDFGYSVLKKILDYCNEWREKENISYSPYGTPMESSVYKFAKALKKRFGVIKGITDKDYITNSYHINVREKIDPFEKLEIESKFQELSTGGMISYCEAADMTKNIPALLGVIKFIYDTTMYAEINTKSDYCQKCGYDGEIKIVVEDGRYEWKCPNCGNMDKDTLNVARRSCGFIGTNFWNQGRTQEIKERYVHLDNHEE